MHLASLGQFDDSLRVVAQAMLVAPFDPSTLVRAMIRQYLARRFDRAIATCDRTIELAPEFPESHRWKGLALIAMGRAAESIGLLETVARLSGRNVWSGFDLGLGLVAVNRVDEARVLGAD